MNPTRPAGQPRLRHASSAGARETIGVDIHRASRGGHPRRGWVGGSIGHCADPMPERRCSKDAAMACIVRLNVPYDEQLSSPRRALRHIPSEIATIHSSRTRFACTTLPAQRVGRAFRGGCRLTKGRGPSNHLAHRRNEGGQRYTQRSVAGGPKCAGRGREPHRMVGHPTA
jgi:hypothetical protein